MDSSYGPLPYYILIVLVSFGVLSVSRPAVYIMTGLCLVFVLLRIPARAGRTPGPPALSRPFVGWGAGVGRPVGGAADPSAALGSQLSGFFRSLGSTRDALLCMPRSVGDQSLRL